MEWEVLFGDGGETLVRVGGWVYRPDRELELEGKRVRMKMKNGDGIWSHGERFWVWVMEVGHRS